MCSELTVPQLRDIAKARGITGRWSMNKQELIMHINRLDHQEEMAGHTEVVEATRDYLGRVELGTIVAFKLDTAKGEVALSGMLDMRYDDGDVGITTRQGTKFKISADNILWVKTGRRWPKWVFSKFNASSERVV